MQPRPLILLASTIALMGGGGWLVFGRSAASMPAALTAPAARSRAIVSVKAALPPGHLLRAEDFVLIAWPAGNPPVAAVIDGTTEATRLVGSVTRRAFAMGELMSPSAVIAPGERGFLAALVTPGHRAMAVPVEAATAASGLIWPGDRVDVILTQEIKEDGVPLGERVLSATILENARVLSTDQRLDTATQATPAAPAMTEVDKAAPRIATTVTLEVTEHDAERLTVGGALGKLHLTLRGVEASSASTVTTATLPTWARAVSPGLASIHPRLAAVASTAPGATSAARSAPTASRGVRILRGSQGAAS